AANMLRCASISATSVRSTGQQCRLWADVEATWPRADSARGFLFFERRNVMAAVESAPRATSDPAKRAEVLKQMKSEGVEFVLLWFTDLEGHLKSFAITPAELENALDDG